MKAIKEIGRRRLLKYIFFTYWCLIYRLLLFSPLRILWLRIFGAKVGNNTIIGAVHFINLYRIGLKGLEIGDNCFIGDNVTLDLADEIVIEDNVTLADEVFVLTHVNVGYKNHPLQRYFPAASTKVVLRNSCFVGIRATILPGVTIGEKSAVGACSLVTKDVGRGELHYGIPASFKKKLE